MATYYLWPSSGVSNSNVFKGHIVKKCGLAERKKNIFCARGPHFLCETVKKLVILRYLLIFKVVGGHTDHVGGPHAAREMPA